ncbi:flagellar basal body P-ring formation chaperone FlgA [Sulfitobacter aestuarii]|uniref:Flagella basal body P-ring formation protein FlgA n=1 Tax=Sulfitobacter aestuarii TaxID=2161676 RepID=A0ABW5U1Q2_9RHOB
MKPRALLAALFGVLLAGGVGAVGAADLAPTRMLLEDAVLGSNVIDPSGEGNISLRLPQGTPEHILGLDGFRIDPGTGIFAASLLLENGGNLGLRGQAVVSVTTFVPARRMMPGEVITSADMVTAEVPLARLGENSLRDPGEILGKEVRRMLLPDRPVPAQSVMAPRVVRRGEDVTISFSDGAILLTAPGRALEDGAEGEQIRVINRASNKTILAAAMGDGLVSVR